MCEAVYAHLLEQEPCALDSLAEVVQRLELNDRALEALVSLSLAGQPCQYLPMTDASCLPIAEAGFVSKG